MQRRRIAGFNNPINPVSGGKAGAKDPRGFISGNSAGDQWDMRQFSESRAELDQSPLRQYSDAHALRPGPDGTVRVLPTRINYIPWVVSTAGVYVPVLLVPRNNGRLDITMTPPNGLDMRFSWGAPQTDAAGQPIGQLLANTLSLPRVGGVVPVNDLYVWKGSVGSTIFLAYEGIEALEANQQ
jgi:hypothetical protein